MSGTRNMKSDLFKIRRVRNLTYAFAWSIFAERVSEKRKSVPLGVPSGKNGVQDPYPFYVFLVFNSSNPVSRSVMRASNPSNEAGLEVFQCPEKVCHLCVTEHLQSR